MRQCKTEQIIRRAGNGWPGAETLQDSIRRTENMLEDVSTRNSKMDKELITLREQIRDSRAKYKDVVGSVNALEAKKD